MELTAEPASKQGNVLALVVLHAMETATKRVLARGAVAKAVGTTLCLIQGLWFNHHTQRNSAEKFIEKKTLTSFIIKHYLF